MLEPTDSALYPVLPLRDIVVFPHMIVPLFVGREKSVAALESATKRTETDMTHLSQPITRSITSRCAVCTCMCMHVGANGPCV